MSKQKKINQLEAKLRSAEWVARSLERSNKELGTQLEQARERLFIETEQLRLQNEHLLKVAAGIVSLNPQITCIVPNAQ
jgi:hypothetical protein